MSSSNSSSIKPPRPPPPSFRSSSQTNTSNNSNNNNNNNRYDNENDSNRSTNKSHVIASIHGNKSSNDQSQHDAIHNDDQFNKSHSNLLFQQDLDYQQVRVAAASTTDSNKDVHRAPKLAGHHGDQSSFKRDTVSVEATPLASLSESEEDELIFQLPSSTRGKTQLKNSQGEATKINTTLTSKAQSTDHDAITAKAGPIPQSTNTHHLTNKHITTSGPKDEREPFFRNLKREQSNNYLPVLHFTKSTDDVLLHGNSNNNNLHKDKPRKQASLSLNDDSKNDQTDSKSSTQLNFVESYFENVQHQHHTTSSVPPSRRGLLTKTLSASEGSNLNKVTHEQQDQLGPQKSPDRLKKRSNQLSSGNRSQPGISPPPLRRSSGPVGVSLSSLLESQKEVSDTKPTVDYNRKEMTSSSLSLDKINDYDQTELTTTHRDTNTNLTATGSLLKSTPIDKLRLPHDEDQLNISATTIFSLSFSIYSIYALPISPFWHGLLSGLFIMYFLASFFIWLSLPSFSPEDTSRPPPRPPPFHYSYISRLQQLSTVKGWMYGKRKYDQDQHYKIDLRCVYARLDGSILRLSKPQSDDLTIPFKPEKWNVSFVNQKLLDVTNAKIQLLPKTLSKNKLWSKKYPIGITLAEGKSFAGAPTTSIDKNPLEYQVNADKIQLPNVDPSSSPDRERDRSFYLFATTSHDKEYWFYRLQNSAESKKDDIATDKEPKSYPGHLNPQTNRSKTFAEMQAIYYSRYMAKLILQVDNKPKAKQSPQQQQQPPQAASGKNQVESSVIAWLNALLGRAFFDFWREKYWSDKMLDMIQRRISKLNRPNYIKELIVTDLDLGGALPSIRGASAPTLDERGLWIDLDIFYHGSFAITLETSLNITRPKPDSEMDVADPKKEVDPSKNDLIFTLQGLDKSDSDSSDADDDPTLDKHSNSSSSGGGSQQIGNSRWSRFIKKVGKSKIVQKATNSRLAQRAAEKMSNIPIVLAVEIQSLTGILSINIPPPPSDRLWYGFRGNPTVLMSVRPKLGERKVRLTNITDWIEKKLRHEIKETIVLPHMIDYKITLMGNTMTEVATSS